MSTPKVDEIMQSLPPSHILQDGRFVHLPPPSARERRVFFERSIAKHGLLQEDLGGKKTAMETEEEEKVEEKKETKVHPLALASARIQADGINELNRAINLNTLVNTGEYFTMTNIVDPSLELAASAASADVKGAVGGDSEASNKAAAAVDATKSDNAMEVQEEQRIKASFVLKRKRSQFNKAGDVFARHRRRLAGAIVAQAQPDSRLRQLRPQWRLVAPEHGTRALPHATRPTEVVACDIDVYLKSGVVLGRLARRVPRYATMELKEDYSVEKDLAKWNDQFLPEASAMDVDKGEDATKEDKADEKKEARAPVATIAEPFAIADPALGKLDADFDPKKVPMLSMEFDIEKSSSGFRQRAVLEPFSVSEQSPEGEEDEMVLYSLQHSLFCSRLFESIRRELAPDTEEIGNVRTSAKTQSVVWLSGESETNFLPTPFVMSGEESNGLTRLCVVHCHEGEVKVQLDCEYTLRVKLVETGKFKHEDESSDPGTSSADSGSQSPAQLMTLCRVLLLHAQERYHKHSVEAAEELQKREEEEKTKPKAYNHKFEVSSPCILQSCVSLGSKLLFENRIRLVLKDVKKWLGSKTDEKLVIDWLSLSLFDSHAHFTLSFRSWSIDASIACEELVVTSVNEDSGFRKVKFHSDSEFELYLKLQLGRLLKDA